ncbi:MAG: hypothetical protein FWG16_06765, partial [Micrococcales bacterium]|nr:hypothetical protein [Micrococcales bacterium]
PVILRAAQQKTLSFCGRRSKKPCHSAGGAAKNPVILRAAQPPRRIHVLDTCHLQHLYSPGG